MTTEQRDGASSRVLFDRRVRGRELGKFALNIFAWAELTDEIREELERKREEAIRIEERDSNATR